MEYLEGTDLADILQREGPLPVPSVSDYVAQALDAIAEAHAMGVVHRDLKPDNLFLTRRADGSAWVKVLDFGISKAEVASGEPALTRTESLIGTPSYMSPEHMRSSKLVDARSDIWSLGVILFELISGRLPFAADALPELVLKVAMEEPGPLLAPRSIPRDFEALIRRCLEREPARRFQNAAELADALAPFVPPTTRPIVERVRNLVARNAPVAPARTPAPGEPESRSEGDTRTCAPDSSLDGSAEVRRRAAPLSARLGILAVFAAAAAVGGALIASLRGGADEAETSADRPPAAVRSARPVEASPQPAAAPAPPATPEPETSKEMSTEMGATMNADMNADMDAAGPSTSPAGGAAASNEVADEAPARAAPAPRRRARRRTRSDARPGPAASSQARDPLATPE
jgi:serine/threonine-protein kinase